jgi:hypothetical protein
MLASAAVQGSQALKAEDVRRLLESKDYLKAQDWAKAGVTANPNNVAMSICLLETYQELGQDQELLQGIERVSRFKDQRRKDSLLDDLMRFPRRYVEQRKLGLAERAYQTLLKSFPGNPKAVPKQRQPATTRSGFGQPKATSPMPAPVNTKVARLTTQENVKAAALGRLSLWLATSSKPSTNA